MIPLLGGAGPNNAAPQGALDALSAFGQNGPKMPDFSGNQFGGQNNMGAAGQTNPFSMSGAAGAAASKLPNMGNRGGRGGGGMAGLSGSINKLIASNNKLVAAINKLAASMGGGSGGGGGRRGGGLGGGGGGGAGPDNDDLFQQRNLQKGVGATGGFPGGGRLGGALRGGVGRIGSDFAGSMDDIKTGASQLVAAGSLHQAGEFASAFNLPGAASSLYSASRFTAKMARANLSKGVGSGQGTSLGQVVSTLPAGFGAKTAQHIGVLQSRRDQIIGQEYGAFKTAASMGIQFNGAGKFMNQIIDGTSIRQLGSEFGLGPNAAMDNVMDVATSGGFRATPGGQSVRGEQSMSLDAMFNFKGVGFGSTVMGNIQELSRRGAGTSGLLTGQNLAAFGAGAGLGARGMNRLTSAVGTFAEQGSMFGLTSGASGRLFREALGFEDQIGTPLSFQGHGNALNRSFMTHQNLFQQTTGKVSGMFSSMSDNIGFAFDVRAAREKLGPNAGGVEIMREANKMARNRTPQQKVAQMRAAGMSEDVIQARLLGANLDDDQITFAMSDSFGDGQTTIANNIASGNADATASRKGAKNLKLSRATAQKEFEESQKGFARSKTLVKLIQSEQKLERTIFENSKFTAKTGDQIVALAERFEKNGKTLSEGIKATNKLIDAINLLIKNVPNLRNRTPIDKI